MLPYIDQLLHVKHLVKTISGTSGSCVCGYNDTHSTNQLAAMGVDMLLPMEQTGRQRLQNLSNWLSSWILKRGVNLDLCAFVEFDAIFKKHLLIIGGGSRMALTWHLPSRSPLLDTKAQLTLTLIKQRNRDHNCGDPRERRANLPKITGH